MKLVVKLIIFCEFRPLPALKETVSGSNAIPLDQNQRRQLADIVSGQSSNTSSPSFYLSSILYISLEKL